jgi:predicted Zn-dependent protease
MPVAKALRRPRRWLPALVGAAALVVAQAAGATRAHAQGLSLIRDTEIQELLNEYARPIFRAAGLGGQPIRMQIVRQDSFNAFVMDGQNVFMNSGALTAAETPNQVIGVIAHETGHIAGGHLAAKRARIAQDITKSMLVNVFAIGAMIAGAATKNEGLAGAGQGGLLGGQELILRDLLIYSRQLEAAADQAGVSYLNATRQSGRGMVETFERLSREELPSINQQDPYLRSHPMARDRIAQLRNLVEKGPYYNQKDPPVLQLRHDMMRAKLVGFLSDRNPRRVFNQYPQSDQSLPARYARAIARYFVSDINAALPEIDALIRERPDNAYFHELKGELLFRSGRSRDAVPSFRKALALAGQGSELAPRINDTSLIRIQLGQALLADETFRNHDEVIDLLRKAIVMESDNPDAYQYLGTAYYKKGMGPEADLAVAQARFYGGNLAEAKTFAKRAQSRLVKGSPAWVKADDIVNFNAPRQ